LPVNNCAYGNSSLQAKSVRFLSFIFTNLTTVFIGQAVEDGHHTAESAHNGEPPTEPVII